MPEAGNHTINPLVDRAHISKIRRALLFDLNNHDPRELSPYWDGTYVGQSNLGVFLFPAKWLSKHLNLRALSPARNSPARIWLTPRAKELPQITQKGVRFFYVHDGGCWKEIPQKDLPFKLFRFYTTLSDIQPVGFAGEILRQVQSAPKEHPQAWHVPPKFIGEVPRKYQLVIPQTVRTTPIHDWLCRRLGANGVAARESAVGTVYYLTQK